MSGRFVWGGALFVVSEICMTSEFNVKNLVEEFAKLTKYLEGDHYVW